MRLGIEKRTQNPIGDLFASTLQARLSTVPNIRSAKTADLTITACTPETHKMDSTLGVIPLFHFFICLWDDDGRKNLIGNSKQYNFIGNLYQAPDGRIAVVVSPYNRIENDPGEEMEPFLDRFSGLLIDLL